jgi:hypothetical protein
MQQSFIGSATDGDFNEVRLLASPFSSSIRLVCVIYRFSAQIRCRPAITTWMLAEETHEHTMEREF